MKFFIVFLVILTPQVGAADLHPAINIAEVASNVTEHNVPDPEWFKDKCSPYKDNRGGSGGSGGPPQVTASHSLNLATRAQPGTCRSHKLLFSHKPK